MKKEYKLFLLFYIVLITACKENAPNFIDESQSLYIDVSDKSTKVESLKDIIAFQTFIPLTGLNVDDYVVGVDKVVFFNETFFILDKKKSNLLLFSKKGKFLKKIGSRGNGPGEYKNIDDFIVHKKQKEIIILSINDLGINRYNLNGEFKHKIIFDNFYPKHIGLLDSNLVFDTGNDSHDNNNIQITTLNGEIKNSLFEYPEDVSPIGYEFTGGINSLSENLHYSDATAPVIYGFNDDASSFKKYEFNLGENMWANDSRYDFQTFGLMIRRGEVTFLTNMYIENNNALIFNYIDGYRVKRGYYFLDSKEVISYDNIDNKNLINFFKPPVGIINGNFISYSDYESFLGLKEFYKNLDDSIEEIDEDLAKHIRGLKTESNGFLLVYNVKY